MNPQRALFWKEGRAAVLRVVAVAGLALLAGLAHLDQDFSPQIGAHLAGVFAAILMAMHLVAGERSRGTLPFLSNLPVRTAWLLGVKYAVGAAGLLVVLAAYWGGVYLGMPVWGDWSRTWHPLGHSLAREVFTEVGYGRMLLLWFLFYLIPYSAAFLSSALSNRPLQAAGTGLLTALVGSFFLALAIRPSNPVSRFLGQVLENGFYDGLILLAWSAFEAATRKLIAAEGVSIARVTKTGYVLDQAIYHGVISREDYDYLAETRSYRNAIAHGFDVNGFSDEKVTELIGFVRTLLNSEPELA